MVLPRKLVSIRQVWEVNFLEEENNMENMPEPEMTSKGKYKCRKDNQEYDTREDYDTHCMEEHQENME
jgi:hypothetical protein